MNWLYERGSFWCLSAHRGRLWTLCGIFTFRQDRAEAEELQRSRSSWDALVPRNPLPVTWANEYEKLLARSGRRPGLEAIPAEFAGNRFFLGARTGNAWLRVAKFRFYELKSRHVNITSLKIRFF